MDYFIDLPIDYEKEQIDSLYAKTELPREKIVLLVNYFTAFANFYDEIPLRTAWKIAKLHDVLKISREQFFAFAKCARDDNNTFFQVLHPDELAEDYDEDADFPIEASSIISSSLTDLTEIYENFIAERKEMSSIYIPNFDTLLLYTSDRVIESPKDFDALAQYYANKAGCSIKDAEYVILDLQFIVQNCSDFNDAIINTAKEFTRLKFNLTDKDLDEFLPLMKQFAVSVRSPKLNGFTINEYNAICPNGEEIILNDSKDAYLNALASSKVQWEKFFSRFEKKFSKELKQIKSLI